MFEREELMGLPLFKAGKFYIQSNFKNYFYILKILK